MSAGTKSAGRRTTAGQPTIGAASSPTIGTNSKKPTRAFMDVIGENLSLRQ